MGLRTTDIQVILQISQSVERLQHLQQQYGRRQQEQLNAYMERQQEEQKKQAQMVPKVGELEIRPISAEERPPGRQLYKRKSKSKEDKKNLGGHIDLLI